MLLYITLFLNGKMGLPELPYKVIDANELLDDPFQPLFILGNGCVQLIVSFLNGKSFLEACPGKEAWEDGEWCSDCENL